MTKTITIAVDAMGGDDSPSKIIEGIEMHSQESQNVFYKIYGDEEIIQKIITKKKLKKTNINLYIQKKKLKEKIALYLLQKKEKTLACGWR